MKALPLAGYIVQHCIDKNTPVTNLQLQKILYFVQLQSLKETDFKEPIMEDPQFEAWLFGAVIREVYYAYCANGGLPIIKVAPESGIIPSDKEVPEYVKNIVDIAMQLRSWDLVAISHRDGGAWKTVYQEGLKLPISDDFVRKDALTFNFL